MVSKTKVVQQTKEQMEYEDAKKNFRIATAKARLQSASVDSSKVSQQAIDKVMRIFDDMDRVQQDTQQKTSMIRQEAETKIQSLNQDANQTFGEIQKRYQDLIDSLKDVTVSVSSTQEQTGVQSYMQEEEPAKEEVREKTHEEKVSEIADILLHAMRDKVVEKVNEIMCTLDKEANDVLIKGSDSDSSLTKEEHVETVPTEKVEVEKTGRLADNTKEEEIRQAIYKDIA